MLHVNNRSDVLGDPLIRIRSKDFMDVLNNNAAVINKGTIMRNSTAIWN